MREELRKAIADSLYVHFPVNKYDLNPDYRDNAETLHKIIEILSAIEPDDMSRVVKVVVIGLASPEGPLALNERLSQKRAEALKDYVLERVNINPGCFEVTGGRGFDVSIEAVGLPSTFQSAIDAAAFGANVVLIGVGKKNLDFNFTLLQKKELNVFGSRNALKQDFLNLIDLVSAGQVDLKKVITNTYAFNDAPQAFADFAAHGADMLKVEIDFTR